MGRKLLEKSIHGILVTFRRQHCLPHVLQQILSQTRALDRLVVVDNERSSETAKIVENAATQSQTEIVYLRLPTNAGSAGGWQFGIQHVLQDAKAEDWVIPLDDDDPPVQLDDLERMYDFACQLASDSPKVAAVGVVGARFDWRRGRLLRLADDEICGAVEVDVIGNGHLPFYRVSALRDVGGFDERLFFGLTEVEFGLRLKRAGYRLVANGNMWMERRVRKGRTGKNFVPSKQCVVSWRRYYVIRNHVHIMLKFRRPDLAFRYGFVQLVAKPAYTAVFRRSPRLAMNGFCLALRAVSDGVLNRLGKRVEPSVEEDSKLTVGDAVIYEKKRKVQQAGCTLEKIP